MRKPLKDLIESMPSVPIGEDPLRLQDGHFRVVSELPESYVWPDLQRDGKSSTDPSALVLITAPGAMGKSAAAQAIAAQTRMLYVDLGKLRVGASTLSGELSKAVGINEYGSFVGDLKAGRAALVLDSSDEAQLTCGRENYLAFLEDLVYLMKDAVPAHQIIMLGRRDSTETTLIALEQQGVTPPVFRIAPLSHEQASSLIDGTLDKSRARDGSVRHSVHRQHPVPFGTFRDALFADLARALDPQLDTTTVTYWSKVEDFLGYPPVVVALAERLGVEDNPKAALEGLSATQRFGSPQRRGALLRGVVEKIMARESAKVRERVGEALALREDDAVRTALYDVDEQAIRLLTLTGTRGLESNHPAVLDGDDRIKYEKLVASFVQDHPFVTNGFFANAVFSDYVRAWAISSSLGEVYTIARAEFFRSLPKAGPFFTHFLHALSSDEDGVGVIPEDIVDGAIHSYALGPEPGSAVYMQHGDRAYLAFREDESSTFNQHALSFRVTEMSGVLELSSPISRSLIVTENGVLLRGVAGSFELGPAATIIADSLEIDATLVTALGGVALDDDSEVVWNVISARDVSHPAELDVKATPISCLAISWNDPWHQWAAYETDMTVSKRLPRTVTAQILVFIRRVLSSFKASMVDDPSVSSEKMDRIIIGDNDVFKATFEAMIALGVVAREGNLYRVSLDVLAGYGVSWATLRGDDPARALRPLTEEIAGRAELDPFKLK